MGKNLQGTIIHVDDDYVTIDISSNISEEDCKTIIASPQDVEVDDKFLSKNIKDIPLKIDIEEKGLEFVSIKNKDETVVKLAHLDPLKDKNAQYPESKNLSMKKLSDLQQMKSSSTEDLEKENMNQNWDNYNRIKKKNYLENIMKISGYDINKAVAKSCISKAYLYKVLREYDVPLKPRPF